MRADALVAPAGETTGRLLRVALGGEPALVEHVAREVSRRLGLREVIADDLPWPERFALAHRPISARHPAVQRVGARLSLASRRTGWVLLGLPTDPASVSAVMEHVRRLDVAPRTAVAVGTTPPAFDLVEQVAQDVLRVRDGADAVAVVLAYLRTFVDEPVRERCITLPGSRLVAQGGPSARS